MRDYRIFLDEATHHLFAILTRTADHSMECLPELAVMRKWWGYMADVMQMAPDHTPLQAPLVPVFELTHPFN